MKLKTKLGQEIHALHSEKDTIKIKPVLAQFYQESIKDQENKEATLQRFNTMCEIV